MAGYKRDALELVGFAILSSTFRRRPGEEAERSLTFDLSALYRLQPRLEGLIEMMTSRALAGPGVWHTADFRRAGIQGVSIHEPEVHVWSKFEIGTGVIHDTHALLLSGFYHF